MAGERTTLPVLLLSAILLVVVGAIGWDLRHPHHYLEPEPTTGRLSQAIEIDVYVDTSGSMRHFLTNDGRPNTFREFLRNCEFALKSGVSQGGWDEEKRRVRFWRFGPKQGPERLDKGQADNEGALRALADDAGQFAAPDTPIESAVMAEPPAEIPHASRLRILITDLYQSDGKLERPAVALGRRFLSNADGAVAVYGVRNAYQGAVGDLPGQNGVRLPDAATSMPFYILIAGDNAADVRHAQELLTSGEYGAPLRQAQLEGCLFADFFSKKAGRYAQEDVIHDPHVGKVGNGSEAHLVSAVADSAEEGTARPAPGMERRLSARVLRFEPKHRAGIPLVELGHRSMKENLVGVSWKRPASADDGPIWQWPAGDASRQTRWRITAYYCEVPKTATGDVCPGPLSADRRALRGIHVCRTGESSGSDGACEAQGDPALAVMIDRNYLRTGRKYLLEIEQVSAASGQSGAFSESGALMKRWNLNSDEVHDLLTRPDHAFAASKDTAPDMHPGKTPNLAQFLTALQGFVLSSDSATGNSDVVLSTYFLYVSAR